MDITTSSGVAPLDGRRIVTASLVERYASDIQEAFDTLGFVARPLPDSDTFQEKLTSNGKKARKITMAEGLRQFTFDCEHDHLRVFSALWKDSFTDTALENMQIRNAVVVDITYPFYLDLPVLSSAHTLMYQIIIPTTQPIKMTVWPKSCLIVDALYGKHTLVERTNKVIEAQTHAFCLSPVHFVVNVGDMCIVKANVLSRVNVVSGVTSVYRVVVTTPGSDATVMDQPFPDLNNLFLLE
eukprot:2264258-Rhodomonas_salina.2